MDKSVLKIYDLRSSGLDRNSQLNWLCDIHPKTLSVLIRFSIKKELTLAVYSQAAQCNSRFASLLTASRWLNLRCLPLTEALLERVFRLIFLVFERRVNLAKKKADRRLFHLDIRKERLNLLRIFRKRAFIERFNSLQIFIKNF